VVTLVASCALYVIGKVLLGRGFDVTTTKGGTASSVQRLSGSAGAAAAALFIMIFILAVVPHMSVILTSLSATGACHKSILPHRFTLEPYGQALTDEIAFSSIMNSIRYAALAMVLAMAVGLAAAIVIVRSRVPGRGIIDALAMLPLAVPGLVLA